MGERDPAEGVRLDKWLWVARFFKTRALAVDAIEKGRVAVDGQPAKAARTLRPGLAVTVRQGPLERTVVVTGLSLQRGSATVAGTLYEETPESVAARERAAERRRVAPEPALALEHGRPTKRDRRRIADWNRWSASLDDPPTER
jgi:ribosome-associated heat shock protein Hsp15